MLSLLILGLPFFLGFADCHHGEFLFANRLRAARAHRRAFSAGQPPWLSPTRLADSIGNLLDAVVLFFCVEQDNPTNLLGK